MYRLHKTLNRIDSVESFFKFRFILVLACLKNYKRHDAKFCSVKCFERVHVLQMSPVHVLQMSPVQVLQIQSSPAFTTCPAI